MIDILSQESPTPTQVRESLTGFCHRVQRYLYRIDVKEFEYDPGRLEQAHKYSLFLLHQYIEPSGFKAAAALTIGVTATRPFQATLPDRFKKLGSFPNAFFSILESVYWLDGAEILLDGGELKKLEKPIDFSDHFFREFVETCGRMGALIDPTIEKTVPEDVKVHFRTLALTYEALAYEHNCHCKYGPPDDLNLDGYFNILT